MPNKIRKPWLLISLLAVIGISAFSVVGMNFSNTKQFCTVCHEMSPEVATLEVSSHNMISCVSCHIPPGTLSLIEHKLGSITGELLPHVLGTFPNPIVMEAKIPNTVCTQCHGGMRTVTPSGDIVIPHSKHLNQGIACVACHAGVAHGFVAERGLSNKENYSTWTVAKAIKVMNFDETKTRMEACRDCHDQVNQGKKPWLEQMGDAKKEVLELKSSKTAAITAETNTLHPPQSKCAACHLRIPTPNSHISQAWGINHGLTARLDLSNCTQCHSRQAERAIVTSSTPAEDYARNNAFCSECHAKRPEGHLTSKKNWIPVHSNIVKVKGVGNCLTCHNIEETVKPQTKDEETNKTSLPPSTSIYCNMCHVFNNKAEIH